MYWNKSFYNNYFEWILSCCCCCYYRQRLYQYVCGYHSCLDLS